MTKQSADGTLSARLKSALTPEQWVWGAAIWVPLALNLLVLKTLRIARLDGDIPMVAAVELVRSELFVVVSFAALGFGLFSLFRGRKGFAFIAVFYQVVAAVFVLANTIGHQFYLATGSGLDWSLFAFALTQWTSVSDVVLSEVAPSTIALLTVSALYFALGPGLLVRLSNHRRGDEHSESRPSVSRRVSWGALGVFVISWLVALIPVNSLELGSDFAREVTLHLGVTALQVGDEFGAPPSQAIFDTSSARLEPKDGTPDKNVVFIILESTRADAVTPYNPERKTTPYLNELAEQSFVFEDAYAVLPHTSKALVAILCGIPPKPTMPIVEAVPGNIPGRCLPELLGDQGYQSVFFQNATGKFEDRQALVDKMGFDEFYPLEKMQTDGFEKSNYFGYEEAVMLPVSRDWLEEPREQPFVATYLTLTPHHDYLAPRRYGRKQFVEDDTFNRYLNAVNYLDNFLEELIDQYKEMGLYESSLFVVVGDHGEGFGEHGRFQHDNVIYQEGIHVPWLIHDPSSPQQERRITARVSHLDVVPTVADMLGLQITQARFPGMSAFSVSDERPHIFTCWYENRCIGSLRGPYKYIHHYDSQPDELFDLRSDPLEQQNIASEYPELIEEQRQLVLAWKRRVNDVYTEDVADMLADKVRYERPEVPIEREVNFGDHMQLLGYDTSADEVAAGQMIEVTLFFEALEDLGPNAGAAFVTSDGEEEVPIHHIPLEGEHPMPHWRKGQFIIDRFELEVPHSWHSDVFALEMVAGERGGRAWRFRESPDGPRQKQLRIFKLAVE